MKKLTILLLLPFILTLTINFCYSQDILVVDNGDEIKVKVIEVTPDFIKYKKWENQNGNTFTVAKKYIFMLKYANGVKEVFNSNSSSSSNSSNSSGTSSTTKDVNKDDSTEYKKTHYTGPIRISEPEFDNMVVYANDSIGNGIILEKKESDTRDPNEVQSVFNPYNSKVGSEAYVKNCCSDVRINKRTNLSFLLPYIERVDPREYIKIFKLKQGKKTRNITQYDMTVHVFGDATEKNLDKDYINFTYQKYGQRSYLITLVKLEPGEYAFTVNSNKSGTFYLFGVD